jgi:hypothetical protein
MVRAALAVGSTLKRKCTLSTGQPCVKTHREGSLAAARAARPSKLRQTRLRIQRAAGSCGFSQPVAPDLGPGLPKKQRA